VISTFSRKHRHASYPCTPSYRTITSQTKYRFTEIRWRIRRFDEAPLARNASHDTLYSSGSTTSVVAHEFRMGISKPVGLDAKKQSQRHLAMWCYRSQCWRAESTVVWLENVTVTNLWSSLDAKGRVDGSFRSNSKLLHFEAPVSMLKAESMGSPIRSSPMSPLLILRHNLRC